MQCLEDTLRSPSPSQPCQSSANSSEIHYTPQVKNDLIPKIDQQFDTLDDVQKFYNEYGKEGGFGTWIYSSKKSRDSEVIRKEYVCSLLQRRVEGNKKNTTKKYTQRRRGETRENCGAKLAFVNT